MPDILPPAEGVEGSADITGAVLKDMSEAYEDSEVGTGGSLSVVSAAVEGQDAPAAQDAPVIAEGEMPAPQGRRARNAQERIAQLTGRFYQEKQAKDAVSEQLQLLAQANVRLAEEVKALRGAPRPAESINGEAVAPQPLTLESVRQVVGEVVTGYDQQQRALNAEANALNEAHKASFADVVSEFPEFGIANSQARQMFEEVFAGSPLRRLPNAPLHIALQVRGLLAGTDVARPAPHSALPPGERKQQAAIVSPRPSITDTPATGRATIQKELNRLGALQRSGNATSGDYIAWRKLRSQLNG